LRLVQTRAVVYSENGGLYLKLMFDVSGLMQDSKNLDADISSLIEHDVRLDGKNSFEILRRSCKPPNH
jgi:hypothetical protein